MNKFAKFILLFLLCPVIAWAQMVNPVSWKTRCEKHADTLNVAIVAHVASEWHLYSQYQNGIAMPLRFKIEDNEAFERLDTTDFFAEPAYIEHYDAEFDDTERYFVDSVVFTYQLKTLTDTTYNIRVAVNGQVCKAGSCSLVKADLIIPVPGKVTDQQTANEHDSSLWWFFLLAFGGGLLGILTPCVFPMIPMTISYFMKHGGRKQALFYGASIVFIYLLVGILLSVIFGQGFANFISTHWLPNVLFAIIFIVFAVSLLGYFEIALPSSWINKSSGNESRAGYLGTFFMALTLVLVSFSCTLPIAGAVALGAAGGGLLKPIIGMLGFSLAFALPFTFFAFFPDLLKKMPKSGGWMNTLKVTLGFVELAFALKFLSVPDQTYHWGLLDREVYLALWITLFSLLGFYLLGKIRFPLDEERPVQKSWFRFFLVVADFAFVVYMIPGMFGAPLNALSGWLPPMSTQDFVLRNSTTYMSTNNECSQATFSDQLHMVAGLHGYFDYDEAVACAKASNKPLLLDFTGHGCVNCRKVEQKVLADASIQELLNEEFVVCALYIDDKVLTLPEQLQLKTAYGQILSNLGEKNMYIQNTRFHENSQPCYIVIDPNSEKVLSGPIFYETDPVKYADFLQAGLKAYAN